MRATVYFSEKGARTDKQFTAHIRDLMEHTGSRAVFTSFLDLHQANLARSVAGKSDQCMFYGGFAGAQRVMFGAFAPGKDPNRDEFPIIPLTIRFRKENAPDHRDLLGAVLALGLVREAVGDILVCEDYAVCFVTNAVAPVILDELKLVGRSGVQVLEGILEHLPEQRYGEFTLNIPSARLDAIVAAALGVSREKASAAIVSGLVKTDDVVMTKASQPVGYGTTISIRKFGKFIFEQELRTSKKGRLVVSCKKYL